MGLETYNNYGAFKQSDPKNYLSSLKRLARFIGFKNRYLRFLKGAARDRSVVELGCGSGEFLKAMLDEGFSSVVGVEPSTTYKLVVNPQLIKNQSAKEYLENCVPASIGTVIAMDVFEHIPTSDLLQLLTLIHDKLIPGGMVIFRVPNMTSSLALVNYFGDLTHTTALNEVSIQQLVFETKLEIRGIYSEPFAYPRSMAIVSGILLWPLYTLITRAVMSAFGIPSRIMTPNLVCVLRKC